MRIYTLTTELLLPLDIDNVFAFFSDAHNLEAITPDFLNFKVLTEPGVKVSEGTLLDYQLKLHGFPIRWQTLISGWHPPYFFEDRQLRGPYAQWIHQHTFEETETGTLCRDRVDYAVVGGPIIHRLFVKRDVQRIFNYRQDQLSQRLADGQGKLLQPVSIDVGVPDAKIESARTSRQRIAMPKTVAS